MKPSPEHVASGADVLDRALDGLRLGDNVIWYDTAAASAEIFFLTFLQKSMSDGRYLVYVTFDRSPASLISLLGSLTQYPKLTIIDCFSWGKGAGAQTFVDFYRQTEGFRCKFVRIEQPHIMSKVVNSIFAICSDKGHDLGLVFNSLSAANQIWSSDETLFNFYAACCPRLLEQGAIAYWISSRESLSKKSQALVDRMAQVVIDLELKRGVNALQIMKASGRDAERGSSIPYRYREGQFLSDASDQDGSIHEFGRRLKALRQRRGLSQSDLAKAIGVTPSTISQIESGSCYPSVQALLKIAEVIGPGSGSLLEPSQPIQAGPVYFFAKAEEATGFGSVPLRRLIPTLHTQGRSVLTKEMEPGEVVEGHFTDYKGTELVVVIQGRISVLLEDQEHTAGAGDVILVNQKQPSRWWNPGREMTRMVLILFRTF